MKKKLICLTACMAIAMGTYLPAMAAEVTAAPNKASVAVDGNAIAIGAYNINGYNYFKLRDVAAALNGTKANFEVGYDASAKAIALSTGSAYSATGNELKDTAPTTRKTAAASNQKIILNGTEVSMQAYLIDGYNYFQLRDLGKNLDFEVAWNNEAKAINIITGGKSDSSEAPKEEIKEETDVQKLQKQIDAAPEFSELYLDKTYTGKPGDSITVNKSLVFYGKNNATLKNIEMVVDTDKQIWIDGITFDGDKVCDTALHIKNAGADSAIARCTFKNYQSDAVVIDNVADNTKFIIAENKFIDFGLAEKKVDAAIALNAAKKANVTYQLFDNVFQVPKEIEDEAKMDVALRTSEVPNAEEIYSTTYIERGNNLVTKGTNSWEGDDFFIDIPSDNLLTAQSK